MRLSSLLVRLLVLQHISPTLIVGLGSDAPTVFLDHVLHGDLLLRLRHIRMLASVIGGPGWERMSCALLRGRCSLGGCGLFR